MKLNIFKKTKQCNEDTTIKSHHLITDEDTENYAKGNNSHLKVKHFTHTDISAKVCSVILHKTFANIDTTYCSNDVVDDVINTFILVGDKYKEYDLIIVSDASISIGTMVNLQMVQERTEGKINVLYYNHQEINLSYTEKYSCAVIEPEFNGVKQDSASIVYRHMKSEFGLNSDEWIEALVEKSRMYTTWEWIKTEDNEANNLSILCHSSGHENFVNSLIKKNLSNSEFINSEDLNSIALIEENYQRYKSKKINNIVLSKIGSARVGFVFAEDHINRLASDLAEHYSKAVDYIIIINGFEKINIRTTKENKEASSIARVFGGNGQKYSAGASIPLDTREAIIKNFIAYSEEKYIK